MLDVKDGVSLFRNPIQTMDKLKSLITGLRNEDSLDKFWEGAIEDSKEGLIPVYIPNLLDHSTKVLDIPLMNRILNEAMPELPDDVKKVIVYYIDIEDRAALEKFIAEKNETNFAIELRDLKEILDEVVLNDAVDYELRSITGGYEIEFNSFVSDRLNQKIHEYNEKGRLQANKKELFDEEAEDTDEMPKKKTKFKPLEISDNGLELIEFVSLDCTNAEGGWKSDVELKIDKNSFVIYEGVRKTKEFWNGKISGDKKPLRMKIRNIAGDETIIAL
jgi:adenine-specific DNA-methyltransferase